MTPIKAAADPSREFVEELRKYWSFDNDQIHTHSWHDRENFIARKLPSLLAKFAPAGNAGVRLSGEQCDAFIKATGEWIEPHEPATEDGHPIEMGITQEEADEFNAEAREQIRKGFAAALAHPQPPEAFADEIKRADAAPPEASFDNASDMLGYLNAPREAEPARPSLETRIRAETRIPLIKIAAECHRRKWQFSTDEETLLPAADARRLVKKAFDALHVVGDMAHKAAEHLRSSASPSPIPEAPGGREDGIETVWQYFDTLQDDHQMSVADIKEAVRALKPQDGGESGS